MIQSFIIAAKDETQRKNYALKICMDNQIDNFDITIIGEESASLGIEDVRNLKKNIFLRPFKSRLKATVINIIGNITQEAQNSLLKILEEPPQNTIIVLTVQNKELLLPTILSRCQVITLATSHTSTLLSTSQQLATSELSALSSQLSALFNGGVGERLKLAENVGKNKTEAALWLEKMIISARAKLIDNVLKNDNDVLISQYLNILISFQRTHTLLSTTNVNPRLALENLLLSA